MLKMHFLLSLNLSLSPKKAKNVVSAKNSKQQAGLKANSRDFELRMSPPGRETQIPRTLFPLVMHRVERDSSSHSFKAKVEHCMVRRPYLENPNLLR